MIILPRYKSAAEMLRARAEAHPGKPAFVFLKDGDRRGPSLTYSELDRRARVIAATLRRTVGKGERALLLYPSGLDFIEAFFGCLCAGVIAVPAPAPHPARVTQSLPRLCAVASDAGAAVVLTVRGLLDVAGQVHGHARDLRGPRWIATDLLDESPSGGDDPASIERDDIAFLQYTSGSTAEPRGVMVSHANLLDNAAAIARATGVDAESVFVSWLPVFHDMGLIGGILHPVFAGYPSWLMSPAAFLQRPLRWLEAISRVRGTVSGGPNFAFDLCVRRSTPEQRAALDLSSWRYAFNGAEPVRAETLERFANAFAVAGFRRDALRPVYGLAESTLMVSGGGRQDTLFHRRMNQRTIVACGPPLEGVRIKIVHPDNLMECPEGETGEIWLQSPSVAQGYWGRPEATQHFFQARIQGADEGTFLRTGDLGFLQDGRLFVAGRTKDLIVVRGRKHYPQDIEDTVQGCHPAVRPDGAVAFSVDDDAGEGVGVMVEIDPRIARKLDGPAPPPDGVACCRETVEAILEAISESHELQAALVLLVPPGAVLKTSSGKKRRAACRNAWLNGDLAVLAGYGREIRNPRSERRPKGEIRRATVTKDRKTTRRRMVADH